MQRASARKLQTASSLERDHASSHTTVYTIVLSPDACPSCLLEHGVHRLCNGDSGIELERTCRLSLYGTGAVSS